MGVAFFFILALWSIFPSNSISECRTAGQATKRDLAGYDKVGPYRFDNDLHPQEKDKLLGELRNFLWQHWKEQRRGLITSTFYTIEGDPTDSYYFVEPNARGVWYLRVESKSTITALLPKGQKPKSKSICNDYDIVDRIEPSGATTLNTVLIPETEMRDPQTYRLRLTNSHTKATLIL